MNINLNFSEILWLIIVISVSIIAIKITFSFKFNLNEYLKRKDEKMKMKAQNLCPHAEFVKVNDSVGIQSTFVSPSGTLNHVCQKCQMIQMHLSGEEERIESYIKSPKKFEKELKKFENHLKKMGII